MGGPCPGGYVTPPPRRGARPVVVVLCTIAGLFALLVIVAMVLDFMEENQQGAVYVPTHEDAHQGHVIGHEPENQVTVAPTDSDTLPAAEIFANNRDAVVIIRGTCANGHSWTGSGFFLTSTGIAVTNHHVMDGLTTAFAILYDGREFLITGYYSYDIGNDLAIIQVDGRGVSFDYVTLGNSDETRVGESVFAIGGPDWDPLTFTPGMISRIAYEPINFNIYSIAGMLQSTAAIYGGNSGGPLLNDRGHVIGVNAAAHTIRASVQFAIPINRVQFPAAGTAERQLPIGQRGQSPVPDRERGDIFMYTRFPFIPDFMSVSQHGNFAFSGTPRDLGLYPGDIIYDFYGYLFAYEMPPQRWIAETDAYDVELISAGFVFQQVVTFEGETWVYFYHPGENMSLSYAFLSDIDTLLIAIVEGDVHERFYGQDTPSPITPPDGAIVNHGDHPLMGTWEWDSDASYIYIFRADGSGTRGFSGSRYDFYWLAHDGVLYMDVGRFLVEEWSYTIVNNVLTIDSNQSDFRWSYIRQ